MFLRYELCPGLSRGEETFYFGRCVYRLPGQQEFEDASRESFRGVVFDGRLWESSQGACVSTPAHSTPGRITRLSVRLLVYLTWKSSK